MYDDPSVRRYVKFGVVGVVVLLALITLFSSLRTIDTGKVGVVTQYGQVTGRELGEGLAIVAPWGINNVTEYDVKNQKEEVQSNAATKDLQDVNGTLVINYQLNRGEVSKMHKEVGKEYKDKLITPAINETFKAATAKYNAEQLITQRAEVKTDVYNGLKSRLEKYGIQVLDVSITNFNFSAEFNKAIEAVQIANQQIAKTRQELETTKVEAEKRIAEATAAAEAQRLQQQTLTPELLRKYEIDAYNNAINKWNGQLPTTTLGENTILSIPKP